LGAALWAGVWQRRRLAWCTQSKFADLYPALLKASPQPSPPPPALITPPPPTRNPQGPSGSGKTTLLDLLAGRKTTGKTTGDILFAGNKPTQMFLRRYTGYVRLWGVGGHWGCASAALSLGLPLPLGGLFLLRVERNVKRGWGLNAGVPSSIL